MTDERMTAAAIVAERPDMQPTGERYIELAMTGSLVAGVTPHGRRAVAGFIRALLMREPVLSGPAYVAHREILGGLYLELEAAAIAGALDEPEPPLADLRDPGTQARERQLIHETREWAAGERSRRTEAAHERIDALLEDSETAHDDAERRLRDATESATAFLAAPAASEADDAGAWLA